MGLFQKILQKYRIGDPPLKKNSEQMIAFPVNSKITWIKLDLYLYHRRSRSVEIILQY